MRLVLLLVLVWAWSLAPTAMNIKVASAAPGPPSAPSLAHCPKTCGDVSISYPFGIGPGCFRRGFELICDTTTEPPKLFLGNTTTQVIGLFPSGTVLASIMYTIPMMPGVGTYNLSWESPGRNLNIATYNYLAFLGCGVGVYLYHPDTGDLVGHCTVKCASMASMLLVMAEGGICNGMGCCTVTFPVSFRGFRVTIVKNNETVPQPFANITIKAFLTFRPYIFSIADLLSDKINVSTVGASSAAYLSTVITDKPNCAKAQLDDKTRYACGSSNCVDVANGGYSCNCSGSSDDGNPYILDDCKQEYNPTPKMNCSRSCGSTNIPFPFGFEPGCYATRRFQMNCASNRTLIGRPPVKYEVTNISLDDGLLYVNKLSEFEDANMNYLSIYYGGSGYFGQQLVYGLDKSDLSEEFGVWRWSAANLTCENAKNDSAYACRSANSECIGVTHGKLYIGYRCKCSPGFEGNPYVKNGCTDIDECLIPNNCNGTCYNLKGSFRCCPHGMFFDPVGKQCSLRVSVGIGSGFGVLALALGAIVLVRRLKRGAQRKIRRAFFRKNKGLLLEQLISSTSESVTHSTRIFSLEELEKATNNFDPARVLGHGGHGTVYKGILSDQRVVAIKKSKMVEQSEIDQFVNEVSILSQIIHRNVVKLFGCCLESEVPLLVYEFIFRPEFPG